MSKKDGGGPAFPAQGIEIYLSAVDKWESRNYAGMSLRDYFAGQALTGMLARCYIHDKASLCKPIESELSESAYAVADAMLKERVK